METNVTTVQPAVQQEQYDTDGWQAIIEDAHTLLGKHSQIAQIVDEICLSVGMPRYANDIDDLIDEIRWVFHRERPADKWISAVAFTEHPDKFLSLISEAPEDIRNGLIQAYGTVWVHESPEVWLVRGDQRSTISQRYLNYPVEQIEHVARLYCRLPGAVSPTLEWALINSLLYAETLAFLQSMAPMRMTLLGFGSGGGISTLKAVGASMGAWLWEGIKLAATAGLSYGVGQGDQAAAVMLFVAITGARWFAPTGKRKLSERQRELAQAMVSVHHLARHQTTFNARLVREQAYHAACLGAVFSDHVFEILDRRIARLEGEKM